MAERTPESLSIGELSERTGVPTSALRYYDELGLVRHKLAELAEQHRRTEVVRTALEHGKHCPASDPLKCSRFWSILEARQR